MLSLVVPAYNEESTIAATIARLADYCAVRGDQCEIVVVDDGSADKTAERVAALAATDPCIRLIRHTRNRGLAAALIDGLQATTGETIVTLDADLSYETEHIGMLVDVQRTTHAAIVVASPYTAGGHVSNVPMVRNIASRAANFVVANRTGSTVATFTGMVRAYARSFIVGTDFSTLEGEFNTALLLRAMAAGERIVEIPAHLAWPADRRVGPSRMPLKSLLRQTGAVLKALKASAQAAFSSTR